MLRFIKYRSIENSYREKFINMVREHEYDAPDIKWVATEKIHGGNFSVWVDKDEIKPAKRTSFIEKDEFFFNYELIMEKYSEDARKLYKYFKNIHPNLNQIAIFGELFGGTYPHPDVSNDKCGKKVQKGIYYCPHNELYIYDILLIFGDNTKNRHVTWTELIESLTYTKSKLKTPKVLFIGTFDEMLALPNDELSEVYKDFDLPPIEDNIMEGYVFMPVEDLYFRDKSRVAFKNKNKKWEEKTKAPKKQLKEVNEAIKPIVEEISMYVTENRLRNVLSHIGEITNKDFGLLNKEFIADVMKDYIEENGNDALNVLAKKDRKLINKNVGKQTAQLIGANFLNILDNEY